MSIYSVVPSWRLTWKGKRNSYSIMGIIVFGDMVKETVERSCRYFPRVLKMT